MGGRGRRPARVAPATARARPAIAAQRARLKTVARGGGGPAARGGCVRKGQKSEAPPELGV
jgi:hypothetical protein